MANQAWQTPITRLGNDALSIQRSGLSVRGVLHIQRMEHSAEPDGARQESAKLSSTTARDARTTRSVGEEMTTSMREYEFGLRFDVSAVAGSAAEHVELLEEHDCDDATIGIGVTGRLAMRFSRVAISPEEAVLSALRDVKSALPGVALVEASPDFVGITEVAEMVGRSRQNVRKLLVGRGSTGPSPMHDGWPSMWHLASVLVWLRDEKQYPVDDDAIGLATTNMQLNLDAGIREVEAMRRASPSAPTCSARATR